MINIGDNDGNGVYVEACIDDEDEPDGPVDAVAWFQLDILASPLSFLKQKLESAVKMRNKSELNHLEHVPLVILK